MLWEQLFLINWNSSKGMDQREPLFQWILSACSGLTLAAESQIMGMGSEEICGGCTGGKGNVLLNILCYPCERSISLADTHTCCYCLCGHSEQKWQWKCSGGKRHLLKDRAANWGTIRMIASEGETTTKTDWRVLKCKINAKERKPEWFPSSSTGSCPTAQARLCQ